ncbi:MAG: hypothetical protein ABIA78_01090 [archaeon]
MKKIGVLIFLCLLLFAQVVYAQDALDRLEEGVEGIEEGKKNAEDFVEKIKDTERDSLLEKWKQSLLSKKPIQVIDNFLSEISFVFRVLMGIDYSFSLSFFFIFFVWFYLIFNIAYLLRATSIFAGGISWIASFVVVLIFAQIGFFPKFIEWPQLLFLTLLKFIDFMIVAVILFTLIMLVSFFLFENLFGLMRDYYQNKVKKIKKRIEKEDKALFHNLVGGLSNIFMGSDKKTSRKSRKESSSTWDDSAEQLGGKRKKEPDDWDDSAKQLGGDFK